MNRVGRATIVLALGAVTARLLWSGGFGWFVQQRMKLPLIAATVVLLIFGIYEMQAAIRTQDDDASEARRSVGPSVGWLLVLPLLVLVSIEPTGLGAAAADRVDAFTPTESTEEFPALDTSNGPIEMRVFDFVDRALWDESASLEGVPVRLEGLVVNDPEVPDGFKLTRFLVSCCAADGLPLQVHLHGIGRPLADDTWVIADVVWRPPTVPYGNDNFVVEADALTVTVAPEAPTDAYESPY